MTATEADSQPNQDNIQVDHDPVNRECDSVPKHYDNVRLTLLTLIAISIAFNSILFFYTLLFVQNSTSDLILFTISTLITVLWNVAVVFAVKREWLWLIIAHAVLCALTTIITAISAGSLLIVITNCLHIFFAGWFARLIESRRRLTKQIRKKVKSKQVTAV